MAGAVICFIEFLTIDQMPSPENAQLTGILHVMASVFLLLTLILYLSTWKWAWILILRVIFAGFIVLMMGYAFRRGMEMLSLF